MKTTLFPRAISLLLVFCMIFSLALGCTGCGGVSASSMFLRKTEGTVTVSDGEGKEVSPKENLSLYSGYTVGTGKASYAWIDFDKVKLAKLDEKSTAEITKDGKNLSIDITAGSMFFNVTEPLAGDETMEITTSSMLVGIRGTCGWVEVPDSGTMRVYILEGKVECTAGENTATVNAGEMAEMKEDGEVTVKEFTALDVPLFVTEEVETDEALNEAVLAASGIDIAGNPLSDYADFLRLIKTNVERAAELVFAEEIDFEADGNPELLLIYTDGIDYYPFVGRKGAERTEELLWNLRVYGPGRDLRGKLSLVEFEGRLLLCICYDQSRGDSINIRYVYHGPAAQTDKDSSDWGSVDGVRCRDGGYSIVYERFSPGENGLRQYDYEQRVTAEEYEAVIAQYTEVRVLLES